MNFDALETLTPLEAFRILAAEFSEMDDETVNKALMIASAFVDVDAYMTRGSVALALMAAHILSLPGGANGGYSTSTSRVVSKKEGDLSLTYAQLATDGSWLGQSTYGQLLELLSKRMGMGVALMTRGPGACVLPLSRWP